MARIELVQTADRARAGEARELSSATLTIGRDPGNTLVLGDGQVSGHHARIEPAGGGHRIVDLGSANGTFVNDQRITAHPLRHGDGIRLGETLISYVAPPPRSCEACGTRLADDARFCGGCGRSLAAPLAAQGRQPEAFPATRFNPAPAPAPVVPAPAPAQVVPAPAPEVPVPASAGLPWWLIAALGTVVVLGLIGGGVALLVQRSGDDGTPDTGTPNTGTPNTGTPAAGGPAKTDDNRAAKTPASATPAPPGFETRPVDLARGGKVVVGGLGVALLPSTSTGKGEIRVRRVARAADPPDRGGGGLSDVFDVRVAGTKGELGQPVALIVPLASGAPAPTARDEPVALTRPDASRPWAIERVTVIYHPPSRTYHFALPHLTHLRVVKRQSVLRGLFGTLKGMVASVLPGPAPKERIHRSPHGMFEIHYYLEGAHALRYGGWRSLSDTDRDPVAPPFIEDVGVFLERALVWLTKEVTTDGSRVVFPRAWVEAKKPFLVRIEDLGGDAGASPIGKPLLLSRRVIKNAVADLTMVATHELVHVLQDRYYVAPYLGKLPSAIDWEKRKLRWEHKPLALGAAMNRWFVEATADLWARRRAGGLASDTYWLRSSDRYLETSLTSGAQGTSYAAAHFLDYLEAEVRQPVAAQALVEGDHRVSDLASLQAAVARAGDRSFSELFDAYARRMYIGESPGFRAEPRLVKLGLGKHDLYHGLSNVRPALSATVYLVQVAQKEVTEPEGLLVLDLCGVNKKLQTYTFLALGDPERYLEKPEVGQRRMLRRDRCARAVVGFGGVRNKVWLVEVNATSAARQGIARFWLLLPPTDVNYDKGVLSWKHRDHGLPASALSHYNVYLEDKRLNREPIKGKRFRVAGLTPEQLAEVWVSVVDSRGFEWPKGRPPKDDPCTGKWRFTATTTRGFNRGRGPDPAALGRKETFTADLDRLQRRPWRRGKEGEYVTLTRPAYRTATGGGGEHKIWLKFSSQDQVVGRDRAFGLGLRSRRDRTLQGTRLR